ncbi:conserved hypothetical protein [Leishmania major strain Friedlin]|uniref:Transmembrane protein n=1 Tax=Leishmania major TaxID=5664 RepID=Q4QHU5_LEIMA|nr:conserved hypothetical protein [Leishmania major strain Friedlin]CAG9569694.1 hypothetical_protein_-__conserved [Leishmania major strain Friedlin]CAJ02705.1 conserved hypothetical protein [Leishmania major strain Friedlin]|eukprot:XP_001681253.1 conserved hypothetical protein [Leishmania major strain Friedlin]
MPSRRKPHKRDGPQMPQADAEEQQPSLGVTEDAPASEPSSTTAVVLQPSPVSGGDTDDDSYMSVLTDEEDSYRLVIEHDEHLERTRAYADFHGQLACMKKAAAGAVGRDSDVTSRRVFDVSAMRTAPTSPEVPPTTPAPLTTSQQQQSAALSSHPSPIPLVRTPTNRGDVFPGSENHLATPLMCMERGASPSRPPKASDAKEVTRLQAENTRMAVELQASQEAVQRLHDSLLEARGALLHRVRVEEKDGAVGQAASERQQHSFPAATDACEAAAQHVTSRRPPLATPTTAFSPSNSKSPAPATSVPTAASSSAGHDHPPPKALLRSPANRLSDGGVGALCPHSSTKRLDVAEFFWALQVAPPPSTLQCGCTCSDRCQASATSLCRAPEMAAEGTPFGGAYGATSRPVEGVSTASAEKPPPHHVSRYHLDHWHDPRQRQGAETEAVALACESAWSNSDYYCYHIKEMSSLRVVSSPDEAVDGSGSTVPAMSDSEVGRRLLHHIPAAASPPLAEGNTPLSSPTPHSTPVATTTWSVLEGTVTSVWSPAKTRSAAMLTSIVSSPSERCYWLPYLQRLWVTSVLRHLLLFFLVTAICVLLFIPGVVLATVNVFEAAEGEDFYALHNRFGRSAMLVAARLDACTFVFFAFFGALCMISHPQQQQSLSSVDAQQADAEKAAAVSVPEAGSAASATTAAKQPRSSIFSVKSVGTLVHLMLCAGTGLMFLGALLLREGCRDTNLSLAILGESCYGAGEALLLAGLGTVVSAEVGVAAGVIVSLQILLFSWLIVNALGFFVLPSLSYYLYITAAMLNALVYVNGFIGALVFSVVMLCPRDLIERAVRASGKDITPRKLWSAARHDVSLCFLLRALTVGLLTAAVVLLMSCGFAVFIPTQAAAAAVAESTKSHAQMSTSTDKGSRATEATESLTTYQDSWTTHQRHAPVLLFTYALVTMPMCFIPRLAALINRWCSVPLLTTLLCVMWIISTGASWAPVLGLGALASNSGGKDGVAIATVSAVLSRCSGVWLWLAERHFLNPCIDACAIATGVIYTVVVSSLLRSMVNAGVRLPVMHPNRWRMAFHERDRHSAAAAARFPSESTPLLETSAQKGCCKNAEAAAAGTVCPDTATAPHAASANAPTATRTHTPEESKTYAEELQRCVQMQLRGGPTVMTVLTCMLIMVVLLLCVAVMTTAAVLLIDRAESPVYVRRLLPGVTLDEHLIAKTTLALVLIAAMLVQWVEVAHRFRRCRSS